MATHQAVRKLAATLATAAALAAATTPAPASTGRALAAVQELRVSGCEGLRAPDPVAHERRLDEAAKRWAAGTAPMLAAERSGYRAAAVSGLHFSNTRMPRAGTLGPSGCRTLTDPTLQAIGLYQRGPDLWLLLARPYHVPPPASAGLVSRQALRLVNAARARGARCGRQHFDPAPALRRSATLDEVALHHATDMAVHHYFDHTDSRGRSPAQRVRAAGYPDRLVGENIAYGPQSPQGAVRGWLASPGHCANIMDPQFTQMGIAYAASPRSGRLYWVQLLARPRTPRRDEPPPGSSLIRFAGRAGA